MPEFVVLWAIFNRQLSAFARIAAAAIRGDKRVTEMLISSAVSSPQNRLDETR
jgi:hypothetical protein